MEFLRGALDRRALVRWLAAIVPAAGLSGKALADCNPTNPDDKGPFHLEGAPFRADIAGSGEPGTRITISGKVLAGDCKSPIPNAVLDLWQADAAGNYHNEREQYRLRGQVRTDRDGRFEFSSVMPGRYDTGDGLRPAHVHVTISHPDFEVLTTQMYFKGDPYLGAKDSCQDTCHSSDASRAIEMSTQANGRMAGSLDLVLKPNGSHRKAG